MNALIISADHFEDVELLYPLCRLQEEDVHVDLASTRRGYIAGKHGYEVHVELAFDDVEAEEYDLLILPGGGATAAIRDDRKVHEIVRHFFECPKTVAAICHGPQILISSGVMKGRRATCYHSVASELQKAGASYENRPVVVDDNLVTSREPADLPFFMRETMRRVCAVYR